MIFVSRRGGSKCNSDLWGTTFGLDTGGPALETRSRMFWNAVLVVSGFYTLGTYEH